MTVPFHLFSLQSFIGTLPCAWLDMHRDQWYRVPILETLMVWQKQTCKQMRNSIVSTGRDMRIKCHKSLWHGVINCLGIDQKVS